MLPSIQHIAGLLKAARKKKGLSQRALSQKIGLPQSHISKIENGTVDLQISSLIQLSRALELEFMLIPRQFIPYVEALTKMESVSTQKQIPLYRLDDDNGLDGESDE